MIFVQLNQKKNNDCGQSYRCVFETERLGSYEWCVFETDMILLDSEKGDSSNQSPAEPKLITMDGIYYKRIDMIDGQPKPDAKPVRVLCVDRKHEFNPVIYITECGMLHSVKNHGRDFIEGLDSPHDLIEYKPLRKMTKLINKHGNVAKPDGYERDSYIFQNKVEYTFDGDKLVDVKLVNE